MIPIKELLYDIDLKLNKQATNEHQNIPLEDKVIALNDAQINIIKTKFSENNLYKSGLDSFQKRYNDIEILIENDKKLSIKDMKTPLHKWESNLDNLTPGYMLGIPGTEYLLANKESCKNRVISVNIIRHGDVSINLDNTNTRPSFEYQETIGTISDHKYEIYTDGTFIPTELHLSYIRYPKRVDHTGYENFDGSSSTDVDSELPYYLKEEIVDVAVRNLALSTDNASATQASNLRLQNDE